jgi:hypothetical protein
MKVLMNFLQESTSGIRAILFPDFVKELVTLQSSAIRKSTLERIYLRAFKMFETLCGNKLLESYTLRDVELFKSRRLEPCAPTTVNIGFRTLRAAFNLAGRLDRMIGSLIKSDLFVIDDFAFTKMDQKTAEWHYAIVDGRYALRSIILTSN